MKVNLTYFKQSGKYYSSGEYETDKIHMFHIFEEVDDMLKEGKLPDLQDGTREFNVLVDVPEHEYNHPYLAMTDFRHED